ncbi:unnamed protein product [Chrysoparadoxa australica]
MRHRQEREDALQEAVLAGLTLHLSERKRVLRHVQLRKALSMFEEVPIRPSTAGGISKVKSKSHGRAAPASSIAGIYLPDNGIYDRIPAQAVTAALQLAARLVKQLAEHFELPLPHPLHPDTHPLQPQVRQPFAAVAADNSYEESCQCLHPLSPAPLSKKALAGYARETSAFATALEMLWRDVLHLCYSQVSLERLHPVEAFLLNIWEIKLSFAEEISKSPVDLESELPNHQRIGEAPRAAGTARDERLASEQTELRAMQLEKEPGYSIINLTQTISDATKGWLGHRFNQRL